LRATFLSINYNKTEEKNSIILAQNISENNDENSNYSSLNSIILQDSIDSSFLQSGNNKSFYQCIAAGNIYSEEELNADLQENIG